MKEKETLAKTLEKKESDHTIFIQEKEEAHAIKFDQVTKEKEKILSSTNKEKQDKDNKPTDLLIIFALVIQTHCKYKHCCIQCLQQHWKCNHACIQCMQKHRKYNNFCI